MKKLEETKEQGITLVALVVTIIIMLILSAITINIFLGDKGIFERTIKSKNEYEKAVKNEQKELIKLINEMEDLVDEEKKFIISYNIDIGENYKEVAKQSQNCLEPSSFTPKKEGWEFIGWREDSESSEEILTEKILEDNIELYAVFRQTITLSYNANGGSRTPETQTGYRYYNNGNVANPSFTLAAAIARSGYTFQYWRLNGTSGTAYNAKGSITLSSNATMYATWVSNAVTVATVSLNGSYSPNHYTIGATESTSTLWRFTNGYFDTSKVTNTGEIFVEVGGKYKITWSIRSSQSGDTETNCTFYGISPDRSIYASGTTTKSETFEATLNKGQRWYVNYRINSGANIYFNFTMQKI